MENALFCVFCHFLADMFEELSTLSLTLQRNDLILPQAMSELRKTVTRPDGLKSRAKSGGMLEKIQTTLAQHGDDECRFQVRMSLLGSKGNKCFEQKCENQSLYENECRSIQFKDLEKCSL